MGQLYDIIQAHMDAQRYPVSQRDIARALGVSPTAVGNWKHPSKLIDKEHLQGIARLTGVPYLRVLDALLHDIGYLQDEPAAKPPASGATTSEAG